ncbi:SAM-dependent methyltransferase [Falsiroseomonas sp. CW058]|uniref:SAM-dependent methyltransferase n=1 Tax=Falsiroseomonas sp. CW058 TaxID=3388664 RepID=UPI003D31782F
MGRVANALLQRWHRLRLRLSQGGAMSPELRHAAWNTKLMGAAYSRQLYAAGLAGPGLPAPERPVRVGLSGGVARQDAIEAPWLRHWCARLGMVPLYHRKVWEECFAAQALWEAGMLAPGRRGIGFAVGREYLPAFAAAQGMEVLATDLRPDDARARMWHDSGQHAGEADHLFLPHLIDRVSFDARVRFRDVDMARIPPDLLAGGFDCLWSVCAFEHLGSLDAGLDFVTRAMACLKPGGIAVHTTEFNMEPDGPTLSRGTTVLYQRRHIEALGERLAKLGHHLLPVDYEGGAGVLDRFVDLPPFAEPDGRLAVEDAPHLRLSFKGHVATSIGLIIQAGG